MRQYELTYLISDLVPENELNKVTGKVGGYLRDFGGEIIKEEVWGRRKLAYPINKQEFATYVTIIFNLPANKAKEFEHNIKMTGKIIRHLMLVNDSKEEKLQLLQEDLVDVKAIEEVVGGAKSFEVVEGETEESKDLMAVRGDAETTTNATADEGAGEELKAIDEELGTDLEEEIEEAKTDIVEAPAKEEKKSAASAKGGAGVPASTGSGMREKSAKKETDEADRLSMLDKELDDILGDEIK